MTEQTLRETAPLELKELPLIEQEEDMALEATDSLSSLQTVMSRKEQISLEERQENRKDFLVSSQWKLKNNAFSLIFLCFVALFGLYAVDSIIINVNWKASELTAPLFELMKFAVSSLMGYLFCIKASE